MDRGEIGWGDMEWIDLAQDRDQWRALVNAGNETSCSMKLTASEEGFSSMKLVMSSILFLAMKVFSDTGS
jgi:hypothetical protein